MSADDTEFNLPWGSRRSSGTREKLWIKALLTVVVLAFTIFILDGAALLGDVSRKATWEHEQVSFRNATYLDQTGNLYMVFHDIDRGTGDTFFNALVRADNTEVVLMLSSENTGHIALSLRGRIDTTRKGTEIFKAAQIVVFSSADRTAWEKSLSNARKLFAQKNTEDVSLRVVKPPVYTP